MSLMRIDDLFHFEKGSLQSSKCTEGEFDFITASSEWKTHNEYTHDCEALVFAAAASGSLGRTHYVNGKFIASDLCFIIIPKNQKELPIDLKFYHMIFNEFKDDIVKNTKAGTSKEAIGLKAFGNYKLPYFNIDKQVEAKIQFVNMQESKLELNSELTHQLDLIKQLRQAFLREAMQGKLCHAELVSASHETGHDLLAKIKAEKAQLIAEKKLKKEKELPPITEDEIPFEIPENWALTNIENVAANKKNALKAGPFGSSLKKEFYVKKGYKIYGQEQVISNDPFFGNYYIDKDRFTSLKSCEVKPGDILISLVGTMGKVLILPEGIEKGIINPRLVKISLYRDINREFFKYYLYSEIAVKQINHLSHGSTMNIINLGIIKKLIFPLPPLQEQEQIVAKLEELMAFCDGLEESIKESQGYNEKLLQQVLREALQGNEVEV